jgi:hypothetical protein
MGCSMKYKNYYGNRIIHIEQGRVIIILLLIMKDWTCLPNHTFQSFTNWHGNKFIDKLSSGWADEWSDFDTLIVLYVTCVVLFEGRRNRLARCVSVENTIIILAMKFSSVVEISISSEN